MYLKSKKKLQEIVFEIYRELFKKAQPPLDFDGVLENAKKQQLKQDWFMAHYLDLDVQCEIVDGVCKAHKLTQYERNRISSTVHLGCSPNSSYETWHKLVTENGL